MRIALYQPDIPQNAGAILRLGACLNMPIEIIEPCGFVWSEAKMRRAGMDYLEISKATRHLNWETFRRNRPERVILFTTKADTPYIEFQFAADDILLFGRESAGVPVDVHEAVDARVIIPLHPDTRSINLAQAAAMGAGEALRQTGLFPKP